jgi:hypothetical protein
MFNGHLSVRPHREVVLCVLNVMSAPTWPPIEI